MISLDEYKKKTRRSIREEKLYYRLTNDELCWEKHSEMNFDLTSSGCCLMCSECNPLALEQHHIAGRNNAKATVTVCANHHKILTTKQSSWPNQWTRKNNYDDIKFLFLFFGFTQLTDMLAHRVPRFALIVLLMVAHKIHTSENKKVSILWMISLTIPLFLLSLFSGDRK